MAETPHKGINLLRDYISPFSSGSVYEKQERISCKVNIDLSKSSVYRSCFLVRLLCHIQITKDVYESVVKTCPLMLSASEDSFSHLCCCVLGRVALTQVKYSRDLCKHLPY